MFLTWLVILIGFVICLGIVGWIFIYYLKVSLNNEDATRIDPIPKKPKQD